MELAAQVKKLREILFRRRTAYHSVFSPESVYTNVVMADLARFCRMNDSTFHQDARAHALIEGRREVLLRILKYTKLDQEQFWKHYGKMDVDL